MKKSYQILVAVIIIGALSFGFTNQQPDQYLTVKTYESVFANGNSRLMIVYPDGQMKSISLEKLSKQNTILNQAAINKELNKLSQEGYKLISSSIASNNDDTTGIFVFVKK